jgi:hypothetical protein
MNHVHSAFRHMIYKASKEQVCNLYTLTSTLSGSGSGDKARKVSRKCKGPQPKEPGSCPSTVG